MRRCHIVPSILHIYTSTCLVASLLIGYKYRNSSTRNIVEYCLSSEKIYEFLRDVALLLSLDLDIYDHFWHLLNSVYLDLPLVNYLWTWNDIEATTTFWRHRKFDMSSFLLYFLSDPVRLYGLCGELTDRTRDWTDTLRGEMCWWKVNGRSRTRTRDVRRILIRSKQSPVLMSKAVTVWGLVDPVNRS